MKSFKQFILENSNYNDHNINNCDYYYYGINYVETYYSNSSFDYESILDRVIDFTTSNYPYGICNLPNNLLLYRILNVESKEDIDLYNLGKHFVADKSLFKDKSFLESILTRYITVDDIKNLFIVSIKTKSSSLDIDNMLGNIAEYPDEIEFTIKNMNDVEILNIEKLNKQEYIDLLG